MFDISFTELLLIGVVALIVIGPERLPRVARAAGVLLGRLQRYVNEVKADIHRELQMEDLKKMQDDITRRMQDMETTIKQQTQTIETSVRAPVETSLASLKAEITKPAPLAEASASANSTVIAQPPNA